MKTLVKRHDDEGFVILGINTDSDKKSYREKADEHGVVWRSSWQGSTGGPIPKQFGVSSYPSTFLIDAEGVIRYRDLRGEALDAPIAELLAEAREKR